MTKQLTRTDLTPIENKMKEIGYSLPEIKKQMSFALRIINRDKNLLECDKRSIFAAVMDCANVGLTLDPAAKMAYLIPRWNGKLRAKECVFEPSYRGLQYLAVNEGAAKMINTQLVYENDACKINIADTSNPVSHQVSLTNRGDIIGCYAIATMPDGIKQVEWMDVHQIYEIRERSESWKAVQAGKLKSCTWSTDEGEMMRKTVIKRFVKYLARGNDNSKLNEAIELDNQQYGAEFWQIDKIDSLLPTANINDKYREQISRELDTYSFYRANEVLKYLEENQLEKSPVDRMGSKELDNVIANAVNRPNT